MSESPAALIAELRSRIDALLAAARQEGHDAALNEIRSLVGGGLPIKRGPGRPPIAASAVTAPVAAKPRKKRKNSWAGLTPEARLARVNAIRSGKGLPPREK